MSHWRLYYHLIWATRQREMLIAPTIEADLYAYLGRKCQDNRANAYCINGMPDHVHLIVTIPPMIALAQFVKNLKGSSSHLMTHTFKLDFAWQSGYGAFTISERNLSTAIDYVRFQKEHHQQGTTHPLLELVIDDLPE